MPGADGMSSKFMKNAFVGWTFTAGLYYPPDFDASKLAPIKTLRVKGQSKEQVMNIRMMFPFTMICDTCSEYNYTGTKFTARVETIKQESYLGIKVYRFYGRCRHCWAEFTFKTDPKNSDYTMESGGKRTYEAWKDADMMESMIKAEKEKEAELDQMKALEQKSIDVQSEMQRLEDLDAIRTMNKRLGAREKTIEEALAMLFERDQKRAETQDDMFEEGDREQLAAFKEAQEEQKRQKLDEELESGALPEVDMGVFGSGRASASSSGGAGGAPAGGASAGGASASSASAGSASGSASAASGAGAGGAGGSSGAGAAIASAVAERAAANASKASGVGAKFAIKRKAVADEGGDAKRPREGTAGGAAAPAAGGLGLGSYDSDSS